MVHGGGYLEGKQQQVYVSEGGVEGLGVGVLAEVLVDKQGRQGTQLSIHCLIER